MKKSLPVIIAAFLLIGSCKKEYRANILTSQVNYYSGQTISFSVKTSETCVWDFDDGTTFTGASATHLYNVPGGYNVKLTVDGSVAATKAIKIYNGTASYQVENLTTAALPLVSFSADDSNNVIDFVDDGNVASGGKADTVFTYQSKVYIGGTLANGKQFIATDSHNMVQFANNVISIGANTPIYTNSILLKGNHHSLKLPEHAIKEQLSNLGSGK